MLLTPNVVVDGIAVVFFAVMALLMSIRDVRRHLVRNGDVVIALAGLLLIFGLGIPWTGEWQLFLVSLGAAIITWGFYALVRVVIPRQLGAGDPGVAAVAGAFLGHWGIMPAVLGFAVPYAISAIPAIILWVAKGRSTRMAFAPFLLLTVPVSLLIASLI